MLNKEIWKTIPETNSAYEVSNFGSVRNHKGRVLKLWLINSGYKSVSLTISGKRKNFLVHRLVASSFCLNLYGYPVVNHIDGNKLNNHSDNLEWVSYKQNLDHAKANGLRVYNKPTLGKKLGGERRGNSPYHGVFHRDYKYKSTVRKKWWAYLRVGGKTLESKSFNSELDAACYYDSLIDKYHITNKPKNFPNGF